MSRRTNNTLAEGWADLKVKIQIFLFCFSHKTIRWVPSDVWFSMSQKKQEIYIFISLLSPAWRHPFAVVSCASRKHIWILVGTPPRFWFTLSTKDVKLNNLMNETKIKTPPSGQCWCQKTLKSNGKSDAWKKKKTLLQQLGLQNILIADRHKPSREAGCLCSC